MTLIGVGMYLIECNPGHICSLWGKNPACRSRDEIIDIMNESVDVTLFELINASTETQTNQLYHHSIGEVNRPTDRRILEIFLPKFRIRKEVLTDSRILQFQRIAVSSLFLDRIMDFACKKVWIADLINREELCFLLIGFGQRYP